MLISCPVAGQLNCAFVFAYQKAGFKSGICLLIAPVPVHCFSITFLMTQLIWNLKNEYEYYYDFDLTCISYSSFSPKNVKKDRQIQVA